MFWGLFESCYPKLWYIVYKTKTWNLQINLNASQVNANFSFIKKNMSSEGDIPVVEIAFWGLKTGKKQGGCCLNTHTAKMNRKTTNTL